MLSDQLKKSRPRITKIERHAEKSVPVSAQPDAKWTLDQITGFLGEQRSILDSYVRKLAIHTFCLGHGLTLAHEKVPYGKWGAYLADIGISVSTDHRARAIYAEYKNCEQKLDQLSITEAYRSAGISLGKAEPKVSLADDDDSDEVTQVQGNDDGENEAVDGPVDSEPPQESEEDESEIVKPSISPASLATSKPKIETPPKEDLDSVGRRLAKLLMLARFIAQELQAVESPSDRLHCIKVIDELEEVLNEIKEGLGDEDE
jgi:hypothetical protein